MNVKFDFEYLDWCTQFGICVSISQNGNLIRHAVRGDAPLTSQKLAYAMRSLADWIEDCYEDRYQMAFGSPNLPAGSGFRQGSGASESLPQNEPLSGDEADNGAVQGLGSGSHDSVMRWRPGRS